MVQEHPSLRLLTEVHRIERLARFFAPPANPGEARAALELPAAREDAPGLWNRLTVPRTHRPLRRAYGDIVRFQRAGFFSTGPVPFSGIALRNGGAVAAFRAMVREDFAPVVLRFAADRLWACEQWCFPADLAQPTAFAAVLELAFSGDPACRYRLPPGSRPRGEEGQLALEAIDSPPQRDDQVSLFWKPQQLGFRSERYGLF